MPGYHSASRWPTARWIGVLIIGVQSRDDYRHRNDWGQGRNQPIAEGMKGSTVHEKLIKHGVDFQGGFPGLETGAFEVTPSANPANGHGPQAR